MKSVKFVQANTAPPASFPAIATYATPQQAGDLNVVIVGWYMSATTLNGVNDNAGNAYRLAVGPDAQAANGTVQAIYYASNIAAWPGGNTIAVLFGTSTPYDIRILEYSGIAPGDPLDAMAVGFANMGSTIDSGTLTTHGHDLIVAGNVVDLTGMVTAPGPGFTLRVLSPASSLVEDEEVLTAGTYSAQATQIDRPWLMQAVAFAAK